MNRIGSDLTPEQWRRAKAFAEALNEFFREHAGPETDPAVRMAMACTCLGVAIGGLCAHGMTLEEIQGDVGLLVAAYGLTCTP